MDLNLGYIIYLPDYPESVRMANRALETGLAHGWKLQLHKGVNGMKTGLVDYNLVPTAQSKMVSQRNQTRTNKKGSTVLAPSVAFVEQPQPLETGSQDNRGQSPQQDIGTGT